MKPTKMRNQMIYQATYNTKSKQLGSTLSKDLHKKYGKKSVRVVEGDSITILRGEFKGVDGKISKISIAKNSVAIDGVKKEKTKGEKFDVYIHTSNLVVTSLSTEDKWRIAKLEGKDPRKLPKTEKVKIETKPNGGGVKESTTSKETKKGAEKVKIETKPKGVEESTTSKETKKEAEKVKIETKPKGVEESTTSKETKGAEKDNKKEEDEK